MVKGMTRKATEVLDGQHVALAAHSACSDKLTQRWRAAGARQSLGSWWHKAFVHGPGYSGGQRDHSRHIGNVPSSATSFTPPSEFFGGARPRSFMGAQCRKAHGCCCQFSASELRVLSRWLAAAAAYAG